MDYEILYTCCLKSGNDLLEDGGVHPHGIGLQHRADSGATG